MKECVNVQLALTPHNSLEHNIATSLHTAVSSVGKKTNEMGYDGYKLSHITMEVFPILNRPSEFNIQFNMHFTPEYPLGDEAMYVIESDELKDIGMKSPIFTSITDARHWAINHLDQSRNPQIVKLQATARGEGIITSIPWQGGV